MPFHNSGSGLLGLSNEWLVLLSAGWIWFEAREDGGGCGGFSGEAEGNPVLSAQRTHKCRHEV